MFWMIANERTPCCTVEEMRPVKRDAGGGEGRCFGENKPGHMLLIYMNLLFILMTSHYISLE